MAAICRDLNSLKMSAFADYANLYLQVAIE